MKTLLKIKSILIKLMNYPQYYVPVGALVIWFIIRWYCIRMEIYNFAIGYWQAVFYGILGASVILWAGYVMFAAWNPSLKNDIDSNPQSFNELSPWQRALLAFLFVALFVWSATQLASNL